MFVIWCAASIHIYYSMISHLTDRMERKMHSDYDYLLRMHVARVRIKYVFCDDVILGGKLMYIPSEEWQDF